jgi:methyl-accepting chemotaxis protein
MIILKELSYSSCNTINTYTCYVLITIFIYITFSIYSKIIIKIHPTSVYPPDFTSFLSQNINRTIDSLIFKITKKTIQSETGIYTDYLKKTDDLVYKYAQNTATGLEENKSEFEKVSNSFNTFYENLNGIVQTLQSTINTVAGIQNKNVEKVQNIYIAYQERIQNYVNNMIEILKLLNDQINYAYVSPQLSTMIKPMSNMYNAIRGTLIDNTGFIQKVQPSFDSSKIPTPTFTQNSVQDIGASFTKSSAVLSTAGFI